MVLLSAMLMEEFIALGTKNFVSVGIAGLCRKMYMGDLILVTKALPEDGF